VIIYWEEVNAMVTWLINEIYLYFILRNKIVMAWMKANEFAIIIGKLSTNTP